MGILDDIKYQYLNGNSAVKKLIAINVVVFLVLAALNVLNYLFNQSLPIDNIKSLLQLPASFHRFLYQPWSLLTHMFIHAGFLHLLFNMMLFYWMGSILEEYLGNARVYQAYFLGGILGGLLYMLAYNVFPVFSPWVDSAMALGASASVLAVVVATATLLPHYEVKLLLFGFIRLKWLALAMIILDFVGIAGGNAGGHIAHLGGAFTGYLYIKHLYKYTFLDRVASWFKPKAKLKVYYKNSNDRNAKNQRVTEEDVNRVLDKMNKSGYDSLTQKEKDILYKASNN